MPVLNSDEIYMQQALELAQYGLYTTYPNPAVGCIFVRDGKIIGRGYHQKAGEPHAEIMALHDAHDDVEGATAYVTLEPCSHYGRTPPCAARLVTQRVKRVVICCVDPNPLVSGRGIEILTAAGIEVHQGVLQEQGAYLNRAFFKAIVSKQPYVSVKLAMSLDGKIALSDGSSQWITSESSRNDVQNLRAQCDVILTSASTVIADNPRLSVRYAQLPVSVKEQLSSEQLRQPLKVILDTRARLDINAYQIFSCGSNLLVTGSRDGQLHEYNLNEHVQLLQVPVVDGHVSIQAVLAYLGSKQYRHCLVEAGGQLASAFIEHFADELIVYMAPLLLGLQGKAAFALNEPVSLAQALRFSLYATTSIGSDLRLEYRRASA